ncbi:MAG: NADH-quinone oxidoreductase subunit NuoN [Dehalococcoidia bacterium]|nr:NADH-quinone oxidoreductase subunit NuoN [Dehalococcoidia bacterium]
MNLDYSLLIPEFFLVAWAAIVVAVDLFVPKGHQLRTRVVHLPAWVAAAGMAVYVVLSIALYHDTNDNFAGVIAVDEYTTFFRVFFGGVAFFTILASMRYMEQYLSNPGEYYGLLVISTLGAAYMAASRELMTAYISLELLSFSLYILAGWSRRDLRSSEASMKYFLLGAFSSAILLYGIAMIYGVTGSTTYAGVASGLSGDVGDIESGMLLGMALLIAGLGFKVAAVPFHAWTPDAYEGAPLPITAYISATSKAAGFAWFLRLFSGAFMPIIDDWRWMIAVLAAGSIILGNLLALRQTNIKRLLAYSSIGQVGYMLIGIAALSPDSAGALLLHLSGYVVTNLVLFVCAIAYYDETGEEEIKGYAGLAQRQPYLALMMAIALFSLAGMPLFAGFLTKFILFQVAVEENLMWLAALGVFGSFVSLYYYLMVIRQMYIEPGTTLTRFRTSPVVAGSLLVLGAGVMLIGLYPAPIYDLADEAAQVLFV